MKKLLLLLFASLTLFGYAQQKFQLTDTRGNLYDDGYIFNETITVDDLNFFGQFVIEILVENLTADDLSLSAKCTIIELVDGMEVEACLGVCAVPIGGIITNFVVITEGEKEPYEFHLKPKEYFGMSKFKFEFMAPDQTMTLYANIDMTQVGVKEQNQTNISLSAYPNPAPAHSNLNVSYTLSDKEDSHLVIRNILGTAILNIPLNPAENSVSIDISNLQSGVYFYAIENKNQILVAKKLIIK